MKSAFQRRALRGVAVLTIVALVQGGFVGTVLAMHAAQGDHAHGEADHDHSLLSAKPAPQHVERNELHGPPLSTMSAILAGTPPLRSVLDRRAELCGPSPPPLSQTLFVLRI